MKKTKLLLSMLVSFLLVFVMAFAVACKPDKDSGNGGGDNNDDYGIIDSSSDSLALDHISVSGGTRTFALGTPFSTGTLTVTATLINYSVSDFATEDVTLNAGEYVVDSSDYVADRVGVYTIYVSHTRSNVTRTASYTVEVTPIDPVYGGIVVELKGETQTEYTLNGDDLQSVVLNGDLIEVYEVGSNGEVAEDAQPLASTAYSVNLYLGSKKIENYTAEENGVYTLEAVRTSDGSKDFVTFKVANQVKEIEFVEGTTNQPRSGKDIITSTWKFEATYANGYKKELTSASAGISIPFNPMTQGEYKVTVTYTETDALGHKVTVTEEVDVTVEPNTETLVVDYAFEAEDAAIANGKQLVEGDDTAVAFGGELGKGSAAKTFTDGKSFTYRVQGNKTKGVQFNISYPSKITVYYVSGTTASQAPLGFYSYNGSAETEIGIIGNNSGNAPLAPAVAVVTEAGTYRIHTHSSSSASSVNIYAIYITTLIPVEGQQIPSYTVTYNENYGDPAPTTTESVLGYEGFNTVEGYTPARAGYEFDGWYDEEDNKVTFPLALTKDIELKAHWTELAVEGIEAKKTKTEYVLTNASITIGENEYKDITVTNKTGEALSDSWAYSYKLYSNETCTTEVANGEVTAIGTYYIQVTATKEGTTPLTTVVEISVKNPEEITVTPATHSGTIASAEDKYTLNVSELELTLKATDGENLTVSDTLWALSYEVTGTGVEGGTDNVWSLGEGTYKLIVTATKGTVVLSAEVTVTVTVKSADALDPVSWFVPQAASQAEFTETTYSSNTNIDDNTLFTLAATVSMKTAYGGTWGNIQNGSNAVKFNDMSGTEHAPNVGVKLTSAISGGSTVDSIITVTAKHNITLYLYVVWANDGFSSNKSGAVFYSVNGGDKTTQEITARKNVWSIQVSLTQGQKLTMGAENKGTDDAKFWLFGAEAKPVSGESKTPDPISVFTNYFTEAIDKFEDGTAWGDSGIITIANNGGNAKLTSSSKTITGESEKSKFRIQTQGGATTAKQSIKIDLSSYTGKATISVAYCYGGVSRSLVLLSTEKSSTSNAYWTGTASPAADADTDTVYYDNIPVDCGTIYYLGGTNGMNLYKITITFDAE